MTKPLQGMLMAATPEATATFMWTDPTSQQQKPIKSIKVLVAHGDGTVTRESLTLPPNMDFPPLQMGQPMLFPVTVSINKKKQIINFTLRADLPPMPAPSLE